MRRLDDISIRRLQELPIAEVVERYTHLTPSPNNTICCPFHAEKTPSCHLYSDHLHCFGCGAHTDNIGFVMQYKNVPFAQACQLLAETFHIELTYQDAPSNPNQPSRSAQEEAHLQLLRQTLNQVRTLAIQLIQKQNTLVNNKNIARFGNPHNPQSWCATWGLGYLPHGTLRAWAADNNSTEQLLELGLLTHSKKDGSLYSPFENRLLIPITNHWGHVVGFAARTLNNTAPNGASTKLEVGSREVESDELRVTSEKAQEGESADTSNLKLPTSNLSKAPKYINSPASALFKKGNILFGLAEARSTIHKTQTAHLVEGYTDVMRLHEVGVHSAVARMGTALTDEQIALLKRAGAQNIVILPDNDSAGIAAALKDSLALLKKGFAVSIALLGNKGDDPDSLFAPKGAVTSDECTHTECRGEACLARRIDAGGEYSTSPAITDNDVLE